MARPTFLEIDPKDYGYERSKFVVVPCPHEATTSYGRGTKKGPAAILAASQAVELFDEELGFEPYFKGRVYTEKPVNVQSLPSKVQSLLADEKVPVILGGEHSLTPLAVKACAEKYKRLSVLQLDAHADLRDSYKGRGDSHACAMRRILEICPVVQAGLRSLSAAEWDWAKKTGQLEKMHFAPRLSETEKIVDQLHKDVYITIDVDVFDPSVVPVTGTPEPGGLFWYEVLDILKAVCAKKNVVGFDVVELSPRRGDLASDFTIAKLIYKLMGCITAG